MTPIAPNTITGPEGIALTPIELKAISVPQSLLFLLSIEYDMFLCITTVGVTNSFKLAIRTRLAPTYKLLLENGAKRFGLAVVHTPNESVIVSNGGTARLPLLRYVDYIPGGLHVDELLDSFGVNTKELPRTSKPISSSSSSSTYEACFIDYSPYVTDEPLHDVHGCGFYLTLDYGLSLATHAHLLYVTFRGITGATGKNAAKGADPISSSNYTKAMANFMSFSGWEGLDIRFDDESKKSAVVIMPTTQDANDLLEKYENEESDNEIDDISDPTIATAAAFRPTFHIRPIAPTVSVPYIEDSALRKLRAQHWGKVEEFWKLSTVNKHTVVVGNLYEGATLEEIMKLFGGTTSGSIVSAAMAEDDSPYKRRRVFVTFSSGEATRDALSLDGKNTHGKSLKIHSAPPYVDATRRGRTIASIPPAGAAHETKEKDSASPSLNSTTGGVKSPGLNVAAKEFVPKFAIPSATVALPPPPYIASSSPSLASAVPPPPSYGAPASLHGNSTSVSPYAHAARPPSYAVAASSLTNSPVTEGAPFSVPPAYSLPPPYAAAAAIGGMCKMPPPPPPPHPHATPPPAYTPSPHTPQSPV